MCVTKPLAEAERNLVIELKNGEKLCSETYTIDERVEGDFFTDYEDIIKERLLEANGYTTKDVQTSYIARKKEKEYVYISDHAFERLKQRNGWNKKTALRMIKKVYDDGKTPGEISGYVGKWLDHKKYSYGRKNDHFKVYGDHAYVFNNNTLLTVLAIPTKRSIISALSGMGKAMEIDECY